MQSIESFNIAPTDLTPLKAFQLYGTYKLHFTSKAYNITQYGINERSFNENSFLKRADSYYFKRISEKVLYVSRYTPILVANLYKNNKIWVGELLSDSAIRNAQSYRKYINSFQSSFKDDIQKLSLNGEILSINELYSQNTKTNYFSMLSKEKIHPITASVLNELYYTKYISNGPLSFVYDDKAFYLKRYYDLLPKNEVKVISEDLIIDYFDY